MSDTYVNESDFPCVGARGSGKHEFWISPWALELAAEGFKIAAPGCVYSVDFDRNVWMQLWTRDCDGKPVKNLLRIWALTDRYDALGRRLAVWPD